MLLAIVVLLVLLAVLLGFAATRPDHFRIERSIVITAPAATVFMQLDDFHHWTAWSPWEDLDPQLLHEYSGAARGVGAVYQWAGNRTAGSGRMEIVEVSAPARLRIKLDFMKPFEAHNLADFTVLAEGEHCRLSWAMHGPSPLMARVMGLFFSMDKMVGADFERGLANLKARCEA